MITASTKAADYRLKSGGQEVRVVIVGDVVALPDERWSLGGFGNGITAGWLLGNAKLPGPASRKRALANAIVAALDNYHAPAGGE